MTMLKPCEQIHAQSQQKTFENRTKTALKIFT